jgi:RNAse (barnase) inhibitor barstar
MSIDWSVFAFGPDLRSFRSDASFVGHMPAGISDEVSLFNAVSQALKFPDYFGRNWNALLDCLEDLSWIKERDVILVHNDVPSLPMQGLTDYVVVLAEAIKNWREGDVHKFVVYFPLKSARELQLRVASTIGGSPIRS